jgi:MYXO-CTERM domain-containing protein
VAGGNPTPRDGTLGGNPVPNTATTQPTNAVVPTLLALFVLAGLGGLTALRLARRS